MATDRWNLTEVPAVSYNEWVRSWRQNIETELGKAPVLTAWMETVRVYSDGKVEHVKWAQPITIDMTALKDQELLDALVVREKLTALLGVRVDAILNPPAPPAPEPSPEESTLDGTIPSDATLTGGVGGE